eukprot:m.34469 g.34469  ORF g.34469 m.34469 type:complete len:67 (+) comp31984_c0_seq15:808-1008(+)
MSSGRFSIVQYIVRGSDVAGQHCGYCNEGDGQVVNGIQQTNLSAVQKRRNRPEVLYHCLQGYGRIH